MEEDKRKRLHVWLDNIIHEHEKYAELEQKMEELTYIDNAWDDEEKEWHDIRVESLLVAQNLTMLLEGIMEQFYNIVRDIYDTEYMWQCEEKMKVEQGDNLDEYYDERKIIKFFLKKNIPLGEQNKLIPALTALDYGQVHELLEPKKSHRGKNSHSLDILKLFAVCNVYLMCGYGIKKIDAQEIISAHYGFGSNSNNQNSRGEPIKQWEKRLRDVFRKDYIEIVKITFQRLGGWKWLSDNNLFMISIKGEEMAQLLGEEITSPASEFFWDEQVILFRAFFGFCDISADGMRCEKYPPWLGPAECGEIFQDVQRNDYNTLPPYVYKVLDMLNILDSGGIEIDNLFATISPN